MMSSGWWHPRMADTELWFWSPVGPKERAVATIKLIILQKNHSFVYLDVKYFVSAEVSELQWAFLVDEAGRC